MRKNDTFTGVKTADGTYRTSDGDQKANGAFCASENADKTIKRASCEAKRGFGTNGENYAQNAKHAKHAFSAKYFVIALLLAVIAITAVGVSKWNVHVQQIYANNFNYVTASATSASNEILDRYVKINGTAITENDASAAETAFSTYYSDTKKAENATVLTYSGKPFGVSVSDDSYKTTADEKLNDFGWEETFGIGFTYAYKRVQRFNASGQSVACDELLESTSKPTNAGVYKCVITAVANDSKAQNAVKNLNTFTNPFDGDKKCATVIEFTVTPRTIEVNVYDQTSVYGDEIVKLTATTTDSVAITDDKTQNGGTLSTDLNKIVNLYTTKTASDGTTEEYVLTKQSPVGKYGIHGENVNENYAVTFNYPGEASPEAQNVAFLFTENAVALQDGETNAPENGTYTITTRLIEVTVDDKTSVYGDALTSLTSRLTGGSLANGDDLVNVIRLSTTATSTSNVGEYPITGTVYDESGKIMNANYAVTFKGSAQNSTDGVYTVTKRPLTLNFGETAFTYNGSKQTPTYSVENLLSGHSVTETVTAQSGSALTDGKSINAGEYTLTVGLPSSNYIWNDNSTADKTLNFTIDKRQITVTIANKTSVYGAETVQLTATTTDTVANADGLYNVITLSTTATSTSDVATYPITGTANGAKAQNYAVTFNGSAQNGTDGVYTVTNATITNSTVTPYNGTYDGTAHNVATVTATTVNGQPITIEYKLSTSDSYTTTVPEITNAGSVSFGVRISAPNHNTLTLDGTYTATVSPATITASVTPYSGTYDGTTHNVATVTATTVNGQPITVEYKLTTPDSYTTTVPEITNAGSVSFGVRISAPNHNDLIIESQTATITKASLTITADDKQFSQGEMPEGFGFSYKVTSGTVFNGDTITVTYTVKDALGNLVEDINALPKGTYTIIPVAEAHNNYNVTCENGTLTITDVKTVTAPTPAFTTVTYDGTDHDLFTGDVDFANITVTLNGTAVTDNTALKAKNAGDYTVIVTLKDSANCKWSDGTTEDKTYNFTINKRPITVTIENKTSVYGAEIVELTATTTDQVANKDGLTNIIVLSTTATSTSSVATYPITGTANGTKSQNYDVTFEGNAQSGKAGLYEITNATITNATVNAYSGTYDGTVHNVATVDATTVNGQKFTVEYKLTTSSSYTTTVPKITNAGSVSFSVRISAPNHDTLTLDGPYTATVSKANPTATVTIVAESPRATGLIEHGDTLKPTITLKGVNNTGITDFSYDLSSDVAVYTDTSATCTQTITCTITPKGTNYNSVTVTVDITITAVAKSGSTYYGTVEDALNKVSSGTVYVLVGKNPLIRSNCEIKSGVTLCLPLDDNGTWDKIGDKGTNGSHKFASNHSYGDATKLKASAVLAEGITLTNKGTLNIGGTITAGNGGANASFTCGDYSQLTLGKNAKVDSPTGSITCYGYIAEESLNNGSEVIAGNSNGATPLVTLPFVVIEHRGGTAFAGLANSRSDLTNGNINATPFNRFLLPNITAEFTVNYGTKLEGFADLYAASQHNTTSVKLIGTNNDYLISISNGAKIVSKYNPGTKVTNLNIKGTANVNSLSLNLDVGVSATLSTANVYFPLSWYYNITLSKFENGNNATVSATQALKLLPGCVVTIDTGVTANMKTIFVTQDTSWKEGSGTGSSSYDGNGTSNPKAPGKLIVNGTLNVENINGVISTESASGTLNITGSVNPTSKEVKEAGSNTYSIIIKTIPILTYTELGINENARGLIRTSANAPTANSNFTTGTYKSDGTYWYRTGNYNITYDTVGGTLPANAKTSGTKGSAIGDLPTPTKLGYTFDYWTFNGEQVTKDDVYYYDVSLVAHWTAKEYTINFVFEAEQGSLSPQTFSGNQTITLPSLDAIIVDGQTLSFAGWYKTQSYEGNAVQTVSPSDADGDNVITVYAKFTAGEPYKVIYNMNWQSSFTKHVDDLTDTNEDFSKLTLRDMSSYNDDVDFNYAFIGWYSDEAFTTPVTSLDETVKTITLYAKWEAKNKVTVKNTASYKVTTTLTGIGEFTIDANSDKVVYYKSGSTLTLGTVSRSGGNGAFNDDKTIYTVYQQDWEGSKSITINVETTLNIVSSKVDYYQVQLKVINGSKGNNNGDDPASCSATLNLSGKTAYDADGNVVNSFTLTTAGGVGQSKSGTIYLPNGTYTVTLSNCPDSSATLTVSNSPITQTYTGNNGKDGSGTCLAEGTLITLADGSKKKVEDFKPNDIVMAYDHLTGQIVKRNVIIVVKTYSEFIRTTFVFNDGTRIVTINEHGLYDLTLNKYVNLTHLNAKNYIGHDFVSIDYKGNISTKRLVDYNFVYTEGYKYDIVSDTTLNYVAEDLLSVTHVLVDIIDTFDFGSNLTYDYNKMTDDINKYGLYTYDEWAWIISKEGFEQYNIPIMKVGVEKGLYTKEYIEYLIKTYVLDDSVQIHSQNEGASAGENNLPAPTPAAAATPPPGTVTTETDSSDKED